MCQLHCIYSASSSQIYAVGSQKLCHLIVSRHGVKIALGSLSFPVIKISMVCQVRTCMLQHLHMYSSKHEDKTCLKCCMNMTIVNACGFVSVFVCIMTKILICTPWLMMLFTGQCRIRFLVYISDLNAPYTVSWTKILALIHLIIK